MTFQHAPQNRQHLHRLLLWVGGTCLAFLLVLPFYGSSLDKALYDTLLTFRGPMEAGTDVVIVAIDDDSYQELGKQWPWPRSLHGELLETLHQAGARVVAFDVLFDTTSKNSEDDRAFRQAIDQQQRVVLACTLVTSDQTTFTKTIGFTKVSWLEPVDILMGSSSPSLGVIDLPVDSDGHVRRVQTTYANRPALGLLAARLYSGEQPLRIHPGPNQTLLINYLGPPRTIPTVSYFQALQPEVFLPPGVFKDKLILIGSTTQISSTPNMPDHFLTPFSPAGKAMSGVEIHATVAHNFLGNSFLSTSTWPVRQVCSGLAISIGLFFFYCSPARGGILLLGSIAVSLLTAYLALTKSLTVLYLSTLIIPAVLLYIISASSHYYELFQAERRNRKLLAASEEKIRQILAGQQVTDSKARVKVFISYTHKSVDAGYMAEILDYLKGLSQENIDFWTDRELRIGEDWDTTIKQQLSASNIALVLVSQAYLDSEYCINTEISSFLERGVVIMPIILSPCELERQAWLQERQYLPSNGETISEHYQDQGKRQRMFLEIKDALRQQANSILVNQP